MIAKIFELELYGRTIWRLMATRNGMVCGLGHMIDFDSREEAESVATCFAQRSGWPLELIVKARAQ